MKQAAIIAGLAAGLAALFIAYPPASQARGPSTPAAPPPAASPKPSLVPGGEIFDQPTVLHFDFHLAETNLDALRDRAREYTPVTVAVNGQTFTKVGVKLKGAAGSFRPVDDRPAMTLHFSRWVEGRRLFGLRKVHLNNSVQDPACMNEYIGSDLFRAAGVPTPRVAWATVRLNDRDLGLYVLKEAFEKEFLRMSFGNTDGNLYDGGFVRDIDGELERESGTGPVTRSDLHALAAAAREQDAKRRWEKLQKVLDVDRFATYAALSVMLSDWDGYALNRNNYRVYFNPSDGKAVFLPHGMDQLFQRSSMELDQGWGSLVAWGLFDTPEGQNLYEAKCREVFSEVFRLDHITNTIHRLKAVLEPVDQDIGNRASYLEDQVIYRYNYLKRQPQLKPVAGTNSPPPSAGR